MAKIVEQIEALFKEKHLPLEKQEGPEGVVVYPGIFEAGGYKLSFNLLVQDLDETADFQVVYEKLAYVTDFKKKTAVLEKVNELNHYKTGYFTAILGNDGEVFIKTLGRVASGSVYPVYEMLVMGSKLAMNTIQDIQDVI